MEFSIFGDVRACCQSVLVKVSYWEKWTQSYTDSSNLQSPSNYPRQTPNISVSPVLGYFQELEGASTTRLYKWLKMKVVRDNQSNKIKSGSNSTFISHRTMIIKISSKD